MPLNTVQPRLSEHARVQKPHLFSGEKSKHFSYPPLQTLGMLELNNTLGAVCDWCRGLWGWR